MIVLQTHKSTDAGDCELWRGCLSFCCLLVSYRPLAHAGFPNAGALEAASRGRDLLNYLKACVF